MTHSCCSRPAACAAGLLAALAAAPVLGATTDTELPTVVVVADDDTVIANGAEGAQTLSGQRLKDATTSTGNITDALATVPNVQFSEDYYDPDRLADLTPASVSISGGRTYENQILLDGLGLSSRLDPVADDSGVWGVAGHEQSLFVDLDLIESLTVYESNVPARYGQFTGGVIDARSKPVADRTTFNWHYGTTRADWVSYHIITADDPEDPTAEPETPDDFERQRYGASLDLPFDGIGVRLNATESRSKTPVLSLGEYRSQYQRTLTLGSKVETAIGEQGHLDVSVTYAPYEHDTFLTDVKDSDYRVTGGGLGTVARLNLSGDGVDHELNVTFSRSENRREAPTDYLSWANTASRSWGTDNDLAYSREGGYGDLKRIQEAWNANWNSDFRRWQWGDLGVGLSAGFNAGYSRLSEDRAEDTWVYTNPVVNTAVDCRGLTYDCVQHEQYFSKRIRYSAGNAEVSLLQLALYSELNWRYQRLEVTTGLRYDYDNFLKNHDIAPRVRGTYDLFGDGDTRLVFGVNRYYGAPLLSYKLRQARTPYTTEYRSTTMNIVNEWGALADAGTYRYVFNNLKTPYNDELTLGVKQQLFSGVWETRYLARRGKRELAKTTTTMQDDGYYWYVMNNDGHSRYDSVSSSWYGRIGPVDLGLHATWSESRTTNDDYDSSIDSAEEYVYYNGRVVSRSSITVLRQDYNRPLVAGSSIAYAPFDGVRLVLNSTWRGKYDAIVATSVTADGSTVTLPTGETVQESVTIYEDRTRRATFIHDAVVTWQIGQSPYVTVEARINNLFNSRTYTVDDGDDSSNDSGIEVGRNFWLGLKGGF